MKQFVFKYNGNIKLDLGSVCAAQVGLDSSAPSKRYFLCTMNTGHSTLSCSFLTDSILCLLSVEYF